MRRSPRYYLLGLVICLTSGLSLSAQKIDRGTLRKAIRSYRKGDLSSAQKSYQSILKQDSLQSEANYGQGNILYQGRQWDKAIAHYDRASKNTELNPKQSAAVWHNMGNVYMQKKDYAQAIKSYENALIANPTDEQTRYNLVLAQKLQQRNQQNQNNQSNSPQNNPNNPNNKGQQQNDPKDNQKQGDKSKDKDKKPENPKEKEQQNQNPQQDQQQGKISKDQADQLLEGFKQDDDQARRRYEAMKKAQEKQNNTKKKRW